MGKEIDRLNHTIQQLKTTLTEKNDTVLYYEKFAAEHSNLQRRVQEAQRNESRSEATIGRRSKTHVIR